MYIFKNAFKSISRNLGRNILIGIIILVIGLASTIALSINSSAQRIVDAQVESSEVEVTFEINRESLKGNVQNRFEQGETVESMDEIVTSLTVDEIELFADSSYVSQNYITKTISLNAQDITAATNDNMFDKFNGGGGDNQRQEGMQQTANVSKGDFSVVGYNQLDGISQLVSGDYKINTGTIFTIDSTDNECIVNQELLDENEISVGDTLVLTNPSDETQTFEILIVGAYEDSTENADAQSMFSTSANTIIVNTNTIDNIVEASIETENELSVSVSSTIVLNSIDDIEAFSNEVKDKGLNENFTISTNEDAILASLEPLENLQNFSNIFFLIVLVIGVIILAILNMINLRERKYEIGVLRAIGMKKHLVCTQFVFEIFVVAIVAIVIGIGAGAFASVPVANYMLENEIANMEVAQEEIDSNFGMQDGGGPSGNRGQSSMLVQEDVSYIENINATISMDVILKIFGISVLLTIVSSIFSVVNIVRYNPLRILRDRS